MGCVEITPVTPANLAPVQNKVHSQQIANHAHTQPNRSIPTKIQTGLQQNVKPMIKQQKKESSQPPKQAQNIHTSTQKVTTTKKCLENPQSNESQIDKILQTKQDFKIKLQKAKDLCKQEQYKQALKLLEKIKIEDSFIHTLKGYCNYQLQNYDQAIQEYNKSLKLKDHMPTYFRLGNVYYYKQNYQSAIQLYQKCLTFEINPEIYYQMGLCHYQLENYDKSIELYKKALESDPKNCQILQSIAKSYSFNEEYKESIEWYKKVLQLQPKNAKIVCQIGICFCELSQHKDAQQWYLKSLIMDQKDSNTYYRLGLNYYWIEEYEKAIENYLKSITLDPKNQLPYMEIANCKKNQLNYQEAATWYKKALSVNNKNKDIYLQSAIANQWNELYKEAISDCKKALKIDPNFGDALAEMGDCHFYLQDYQSAIKEHLQALKKNPEFPHYSLYMIAKSYYFNQYLQQALPYFDKAIKQAPTLIIYQVYYGKCLFEVENFTESFKVFTKAKELYQTATDLEDFYEKDFMISQINTFIKNAAVWQQKKKIGYISPQDKEDIKKMRKNFQKKYKAIFGVQSPDKKQTNFKPLDKRLLQVVKMIYEDKFSLDITNLQESKILNIAPLIRQIFDYDSGAFQIFAYMFQEFMWLQKFEFKQSIPQIEKSLNSVLKILSDKYPPTSKKSMSVSEPVEFASYKQIKMDLFTDFSYFQSYDIVVKQVEKINVRAKNDLAPFKEFVYTLQKRCNGNHAKCGMKLPEKKENMIDLQKEDYEQRLFKVLMRIFQKMFKQIVQKKEEMLVTIDSKIKNSKKMPLYAVNQIIMNIWIEYINQILQERKEKGVKTECYITDLVRGKCMFDSIQAIKNAVDGVVQLCKEKGYQIMELDNRILKITQDVVFKIKIKEVVSQLQLALKFDTVAFDFGHNFYEILRCPLGCIFGSSLFLTKDVSESFLKQVANAEAAIKNIKPLDKQSLEALQYVMDTFKKSNKTRHRS